MSTVYTAPEVKLIASTQFFHPHDVPWETDTNNGGLQVIEYAGRNCYLSWDNPGKKTNADYIKHINTVGHGSVLEHAQATFSIARVSRSLTHELVRHRHLSPSQQSQRYVDEGKAGMILPPLYRGNEWATQKCIDAFAYAQEIYRELVIHGMETLTYIENKTERRKKARQAARAVLPNMTETRIVMTGNFRAWRWFLKLRGNRHADEEIRQLALDIYVLLAALAPPVFSDFRLNQDTEDESLFEVLTELPT